jgi:hypothetical protein
LPRPFSNVTKAVSKRQFKRSFRLYNTLFWLKIKGKKAGKNRAVLRFPGFQEIKNGSIFSSAWRAHKLK